MRHLVALIVGCSLLMGSGDLSGQRSSIPTIVNDKARWTKETRWHVSATPVITIGSIHGPEEHALYRAIWSGFLSDGTIAVLNAGSGSVRIYSPEGNHLRSFGRLGKGPAELSQPMGAVILPGDTIAILDGHSIKFFTTLGELVKTVTIATTRRFPPPSLVSRVPTGFVVSEGDFASRRFQLDGSGNVTGPAEVSEGVDRGSFAHIVYSPTGALVDTILVAGASGETWITKIGQGRRYTSIPHSPGQFTAFGAGVIVTGHSARPVLTFLSSRGDTALRAELPLPSSRLSSREFWTSVERRHDGDPSITRDRPRSLYEQMPKYEHLPYFGSLNVSSDGSIWVGSYSPSYLASAPDPVWYVVSQGGVYLGRILNRPRMWVDEITDRFVLGRTTGDLDVEQVVVYEIVRP